MRREGGLWQWIRGNAGWIATGAFTIACVVVASHFLWPNESESRSKLLPPDTPPAEYLYLDTDRVLAYLGQIENGLSDWAKRIESQKHSTTAAVKGGLLADISGSAERQTTIEETVTPVATDRSSHS